MKKQFYVYEWYVVESNYIIYVGKGSGDRYKSHNKKNKDFKRFIKSVKCDVRILQYFDDEKDAFYFEKFRTEELKLIGQCPFNVVIGGTGGQSWSWTDEMRLKYSANNVMKSESQRKRMKANNPMKDKKIALLNGKRHKKAIYINGTYYNGTVDAAKELGVATNTILTWLRKGHDADGNPCRYDGKPQKEYFFEKKVSCSKKVWVEDALFYSVKDAAMNLGTTSDNLIKFLKKGRAYKGINVKYDNQQPSQGKP